MFEVFLLIETENGLRKHNTEASPQKPSIKINGFGNDDHIFLNINF